MPPPPESVCRGDLQPLARGRHAGSLAEVSVEAHCCPVQQVASSGNTALCWSSPPRHKALPGLTKHQWALRPRRGHLRCNREISRTFLLSRFREQRFIRGSWTSAEDASFPLGRTRVAFPRRHVQLLWRPGGGAPLSLHVGPS